MLQGQGQRKAGFDKQQKVNLQSSNILSSDFNPPMGQGAEENESSFSREIDSYYCDFYLTKHRTLKIVLTSQIDASVYGMELSQQQKEAQDELNFFDSIEEIYQSLQETSAQEGEQQGSRSVRIDQEGRILMRVISILGKKERIKEISLKTNKLEGNKEAYLENVLKKMSKNLMEMKKTIANFIERQESFQKKNAQLLQRLRSKGTRLEFKPDKADPHSQQFLRKDKRITKINDNTSYYNLISEASIPKTGTSYFHVKVAETAQRNIIVGIGSKFIRGIQNAYTHPDFIGFYLFGQGYVWEKTNQRDLHLKSYPIESGALITAVVDMDMGFICWQICRVRVAYAVIPLELKAKLLLPVVMMINVNDSIVLP